MIREDHNQAASAEQTARMVREEVIMRPARRAAAFCAIVMVALTATTFAGASESERPGAGFEIRAEIASAHPAPASPN
jgi:hypothetical protein